MPGRRGLRLTSGINIVLDDTDIEISRTGSGLSMKLQAKDCAGGGSRTTKLAPGSAGS